MPPIDPSAAPTPPANPPPVIIPPPPAMIPSASATGAVTAIGELMKNKWVAGAVALSCAVAVTLNTMQLTNVAAFPHGLMVGANLILGVATILNVYSPGVRNMALTALLALSLMSSPAFAQELHVGPSLPLVQVTPGDKHPVSIAPGAGVTVGVDLLPLTFLGRQLYGLSVGFDVFGSVNSVANAVAGGLMVALQVALAESLTLGVGAKLFTSDKVGFLDGPASYGHSWFILFGLSDGLLNWLQVGHQGSTVAAAPVQQACDGDHPCEPTLDQSTVQ